MEDFFALKKPDPSLIKRDYTDKATPYNLQNVHKHLPPPRHSPIFPVSIYSRFTLFYDRITHSSNAVDQDRRNSLFHPFTLRQDKDVYLYVCM